MRAQLHSPGWAAHAVCVNQAELHTRQATHLHTAQQLNACCCCCCCSAVVAPGYGWTLGDATLCPIGSYNAGYNSRTCTRCPGGLTTTSTGANSSQACVAPPGASLACTGCLAIELHACLDLFSRVDVLRWFVIATGFLRHSSSQHAQSAVKALTVQIQMHSLAQATSCCVAPPLPALRAPTRRPPATATATSAPTASPLRPARSLLPLSALAAVSDQPREHQRYAAPPVVCPYTQQPAIAPHPTSTLTCSQTCMHVTS